MTTIRKILLGAGSAAILAGLATTASAQASNTASATINASIIQPVTIANAQDISFGTIAKPISGSSVITIDDSTDTTPVSSNNTNSQVLAQGTRGKFTITGEAGRTYSGVDVGGTINLTGTGTDIVFTPTYSVSGGGAVGTLPAGTEYAGVTQTLNVGGSFTLTDAQVAGLYSGSLEITVAYE
jgi:hypothetical protein